MVFISFERVDLFVISSIFAVFDINYMIFTLYSFNLSFRFYIGYMLSEEIKLKISYFVKSYT